MLKHGMLQLSLCRIIRAQVSLVQPSTFYLGRPAITQTLCGSLSYSTASNNQQNMFEAAQQKLLTLTKSPGNEAKLKIYGLFKQATIGSVNTKRPGMTDFVGKAKWDAWNALGSMSQDDARQRYIDYVNELVGKDNPPDSTGNLSTSNTELHPGFEIIKDGNMQIIKFNKPDKKNAISRPMYRTIVKLLKDAGEDPSVTLVAITGAGNYFSSGNDLSNFTDMKGTVAEEAEIGRKILLEFVAAFIDFPKPLIGVVNGPAIGIACTMLGLMDAVYASDRGWFQTPFSALGQSPEACSSILFPRIMGPAKANEMLLFNKRISTEEACNLGFVTEVFPDAKLQSEVWPKLKKLSELPVKSLVYSKELTRQFDRELLHKVNIAECERLVERWQSEDCAEAIMKFFSERSKQ